MLEIARCWRLQDAGDCKMLEIARCYRLQDDRDWKEKMAEVETKNQIANKFKATANKSPTRGYVHINATSR
jgi:hypothetical protein